MTFLYLSFINTAKMMEIFSGFDKQPELEDELIKVVPLKETNFMALYKVASDPFIWKQHPNKNRYQHDVFKTFFQGAMDSKGAFLVIEKATGAVIGSSRYYDWDEQNSQIAIGYTFMGRRFWGKGYNKALKTLMLKHAFKQVNTVVFHIGSQNIRSQKAMEKIGGKKIGEIDVAYYGEPTKPNYIYQITKEEWTNR